MVLLVFVKEEGEPSLLSVTNQETVSRIKYNDHHHASEDARTKKSGVGN